MVGIFIGIAAVVGLISLGQGMENAINEQFEMMGANKLIVMPGTGFSAINSADKLTKNDLKEIEKLEGVEIAAEVIYSTTLVDYKDETKPTLIIGIPTDRTADILRDMQGFEAEKGRELKEGDKDKATAGYLVARDKSLFERGVKLRDRITIKGKDFKVVGIIKQIGNPQDDSQIYIPIESARELFEKEDEIDVIYIQVKDGFLTEEVAEDIKKELRDIRNEKEDEESFSVQTFEQILESFSRVFNVVRTVLVGIAAISLIVGGIGIMNTMYTSVLERTKEIGTMKAVGAKNSDILLIFLFESGLLGLVGGAIGIALGAGLAKGVELVATASLGSQLLKPDFSVYLIFGTLFFSFFIGTLSGIFPAMQASKLKPADALRYE